MNKLWNGDVPLVYTFWLYYFVGVIVLSLLAVVIGPVFAIVNVIWIAFMVLPIWKSANKYNGNKLFALLAKISAVVSGIGVLGIFL